MTLTGDLLSIMQACHNTLPKNTIEDFELKSDAIKRERFLKRQRNREFFLRLKKGAG